MENSHYQKVKDMVKKVIDENFIKEPPVNIRKLVLNYGLDLQFAVFGDNKICGFLDINEKKIWVNYNDNSKRQNFTIAHELGHWLLHREDIEKDPKSYKVLFRYPLGQTTDIRETEANKFAANLLVPTEMLKVCKKAKFSEEKMSVLFHVSPTVISYRLQQEGIDD
ncbi:MAG: ImmA/IrrE family metallo-endopeptidase [Cyanobacteriota bacterium]|nr:ImmA/IrrE family metallo-endopeptidase [Cyanobacteriota bacterium]